MVNKTQYCVGKYMNVSNIHVFGLWEEAIVFEENVQGLHPQPSCMGNLWSDQIEKLLCKRFGWHYYRSRNVWALKYTAVQVHGLWRGVAWEWLQGRMRHIGAPSAHQLKNAAAMSCKRRQPKLRKVLNERTMVRSVSIVISETQLHVSAFRCPTCLPVTK